MKYFIYAFILISLPVSATLTVEDPENLSSRVETTSDTKRQASDSTKPTKTSEDGKLKVQENNKTNGKEAPFQIGPYDSEGNYRIQRENK